jgi:hypothetical protein
MKYINLFESFNNFQNTEEDINRICRKYSIKNYTINQDMSIDVDDDVVLYDRGLVKLPLRFNKIRGNFNCYTNKLTTLVLPKGGNLKYFYQWQLSIDEINWVNIQNANLDSYQPPKLYITSFYRLINFSGMNCGFDTSNIEYWFYWHEILCTRIKQYHLRKNRT